MVAQIPRLLGCGGRKAQLTDNTLPMHAPANTTPRWISNSISFIWEPSSGAKCAPMSGPQPRGTRSFLPVVAAAQ